MIRLRAFVIQVVCASCRTCWSSRPRLAEKSRSWHPGSLLEAGLTDPALNAIVLSLGAFLLQQQGQPFLKRQHNQLIE